MQIGIWMVFAVVWGVVASNVSKRSGGNPVTGFVWGFVLGLIGLGVVFFKAHRRKQALAAAV